MMLMMILVVAMKMMMMMISGGDEDDRDVKTFVNLLNYQTVYIVMQVIMMANINEMSLSLNNFLFFL